MANKAAKTGRQLSVVVGTARILLRPQYRGPLLVAVVVLASLASLVAAWNKWGAPATQGPEYLVTPDKITVTPQPPWIHADVRAEVIQSANLSRLDLRDRGLVEQVSRAFALHAWVAKVCRVEKRFPAQVVVDLEYRRPVAVVETTSSGQPHLWIVDAAGVLLPSDDFASNQAQDFPRIVVGSANPAGVYGSPWGDERGLVASAARIAALWGDQFHAAGLYRIVAVEEVAGRATFELRTAGQTRIVWGAAPGRESPGELAPQQKVAALLAHIADKGALDRPGGERLIDLRTGSSSR